jgi:hypothetical protein
MHEFFNLLVGTACLNTIKEEIFEGSDDKLTDNASKLTLSVVK